MRFLIYTKYNFINLIKNKIIAISLSLYYALLIVFLFVLPKFAQLTYVEIFSNKSLLSIINLVLITAVVAIIIFLFKQGYEDGSELIIQSKVITKTEIIWSKLVLILLLNLLITMICVAITSFTLLSNDRIESIRAGILGSFFGPLITCTFWSGVTIICCLFLNKTAIYLLILGLNAVLSIVNFVFTLANVMPSKVVDKSDIDYVTVQLRNNETNATDNFGIATYNNSAINANTIINNKTLSELGYNVNDLLHKLWRNGLYKSSILETSYLDICATLCSFYGIFIPNWSIYQFTYSDKNFVNNDPTFYLEFNNLSQNINMNNYSSINNKLYLAALNYNSTYLYSNMDYEYVYLPSPNFDSKIGNYQLQTFYKNDLALFYQTYFSNVQIQKAKDFQAFLLKNTTNPNWHTNIANYYFSLISSYLATLFNVNMTNYMNNSNFQTYLINYLFRFQYYTYLLMKDYFSSNPVIFNDIKNVSTDTINIWFSILSQPNNITSWNQINQMKIDLSNSYMLIWQAQKNNNLINNLKTANPNSLAGFMVKYKLPLGIINTDQMQTLATINWNSVYNFAATIPTWLISSVLLLFLSASMILKKDIR